MDRSRQRIAGAMLHITPGILDRHRYDRDPALRGRLLRRRPDGTLRWADVEDTPGAATRPAESPEAERES